MLTGDSLDYPWAEVPAPGQARQVAPGILWARLPLPFRLNHVNVWLIDDDDGWTVIDAGCATPAGRDAWAALRAGPMKGGRIRRVIATHGHVDHVGLIGELVGQSDSDFCATFGEWAWARMSHVHDVPGAIDTLRGYLLRNGFDPAGAEAMVANRRGFIDLSVPLPGWLTALRDRGKVTMAGRDWDIIVTGGHAHEHTAFHDPAGRVLIAGDQILPGISPAITVLEMVPDGDPLDDFLQSFARFGEIAVDALVLPSHGRPFRGLHSRMAELSAHHRDRLATTRALLRHPLSALVLSRRLFPKVTDAEQTGFALGETLAHVNWLLRRGQIEVQDAGAPVWHYRATA